MQSQRFSLAPQFIRLAVPLGLLLLAAALLLSTHQLEAGMHGRRSQLPAEIGPLTRYSPHTSLPSECSAHIAEARLPVQYTLRHGETIGQVLRRLGLSGAEAHRATSQLAEHVSLRAIKAGNRYAAFFNPDSTLAAIDLTLEDAGHAELRRSAQPRPDAEARAGAATAPAAAAGWLLVWQPFRRATELRAIQGTLDGAAPSLEAAILRAGGPPGLAYRMAEALQWDLDFARDLRRGDHFQALYEATRLDGRERGIGSLVALVYDAQGRRHEAYRYGDAEVFYDGEGRPLKKMFLRSPLRYTHITSVFSAHRFHPVLGEDRPHNGVDYGAPVGTPVEVTAGGMVTFAGWDGGGGNVVKVQHGADYVTAYLHLSRFAPGIHPGGHVRQGETIAFTGATGLATGPHLDYRVKFRGNWVDPLSLAGVRDEPIAETALASFRSWRNAVRSSLASGVVAAALRLPGSQAPESRLAGLGPGAGGATGGRAPNPTAVSAR
jgi:murein DD-endopeptidase MepM/ murein hydrolase activator NlpD